MAAYRRVYDSRHLKALTGLPVEESARMTEDRDKYGETTSMVWPTLGSRTAKEQNIIIITISPVEET